MDRNNHEELNQFKTPDKGKNTRAVQVIHEICILQLSVLHY